MHAVVRPTPTVTGKLRVVAFPCRSVAVQLTVVVPSGKTEPDAGMQALVAIASSSLAVTSWSKETTTVLESGDVVSADTAGGTVSCGGVASTISYGPMSHLTSRTVPR